LSNPQSLFRPEALAAKQTNWLGSVLLIRPVSFAIAAWVATVLALAVVALLMLGEYTKRTRVVGLLVPDKGFIKVVPTQAGVITARHVQEGQQVQAGQALFTLSLDRIAASNASSAAFLSQAQGGGGGSAKDQGASAAILQRLTERKNSLKVEQEQQTVQLAQQQNSLNQRITSTNLELDQLAKELATQRQRVASVDVQLAKIVSLAEQKFVSDMALQQKRDELLDQQSRLQGIERAVIERQRDKATLQNELVQVRTRSDREREQLGRAVSELDSAAISTEAQREIIVTAPQAGTVTAIVGELGQMASGSPLLTILPADAKLVAQLYAPSNAVGFVDTKQKVNIRFAAYPYQKFGSYEGQVTQVSRVALSASELPQALGGAPGAGGSASGTTNGAADGLYRITVELAQQSVSTYGNQTQLTAGMQLEADILQETRRLIEWVLEPLFSLKGKA
jgi:membrane fusion protein